MNDNISRISNSFSTGGGGNNFENRIQALFLLSLLVEGYCPVMNLTTKGICFQAKNYGFAIDDLVVYTESNGQKGKLLCQAKHSIKSVGSRNIVFRSVVKSAWSDFVSSQFDKDNDFIALATAQISVDSLSALRFLHDQAIAASDAKDFMYRLSIPYFSNKNNVRILNVIADCITFGGYNRPTDDELWLFCKAFVVLLFDLDYETSINKSLATSLIKCYSSADAKSVWSQLVDYAARCNQIADKIDIDKFDRDILIKFGYENKYSFVPKSITEIDIFIPIVALIGSWDDDNTNDREIIEKISGVEYSSFQSKARNLISQHSDYLQLNNGYWSVIQREDLILLCKELIFDDLIERLIEATALVLSEKNKRFIGDIYIKLLSTKEYDHSDGLRIELVKSLCIIKKQLPQLENCNRNKIESGFALLVKKLINNKDWIALASLKDCIQYLAELSPDVFLECIEDEIVNKPHELMSLFPRNENSGFGDWNLMTNLLWSLEILAWYPECLVRSIRILSMLEGLKYEKTNWSNTPLNSIVSILLPWYPQTLADSSKRKNAIKCIKNDDPDVFWTVLLKLLPNQTITTIANPRPQYSIVSIPDKIIVTQQELNDEFAYMLDLAVDVAFNNVQKISEICNQINYMQANTFNRYSDYCIRVIDNCSEEQCYTLWIEFRKELSVIIDSALSDNRISRVQELINKLEPKDIRVKYRDLYDEDVYSLFKTDKWWEEIEQKKNTAIPEIYNQYGSKETAVFGKVVGNIKDVGFRLGKVLSDNQLSSIIDDCYSENLSIDFVVSCLMGFVQINGADRLNETSLINYDNDFIVNIFSKCIFNLCVYRVFENVLSDNSLFWSNVSVPYACKDNENDVLTLLVDKLVANRRFVEAVNILGRSNYKNFKAESICLYLYKAGTENSSGNETIDNYAMLQLFAWLHDKEDADYSVISKLEFIYLPIFDENCGIKPVALYTRLSTEPEYFCSLFEAFYKRKNTDKKVNEDVKHRLFEILFQYKVTPGINRDGVFDADVFKNWIDYVVKWSKENDCYELAMQTVGSGLSYAEIDENKLPVQTVIEELNKAENNELRRGYFLGILNQRGVVWVDPEGKPEIELSNDYSNRAECAEALGFSRYADILRDVSNKYKKEAERHINDARKLDSGI